MVKKNKMYLTVRIISDPEFAVLFANFEDYDKTFVNVTDFIPESELNDFRNSILKDDLFIDTKVKLEVDVIFGIFEQYCKKLTKEIVELREMHNDFE